MHAIFIQSTLRSLEQKVKVLPVVLVEIRTFQSNYFINLEIIHVFCDNWHNVIVSGLLLSIYRKPCVVTIPYDIPLLWLWKRPFLICNLIYSRNVMIYFQFVRMYRYCVFTVMPPFVVHRFCVSFVFQLLINKGETDKEFIFSST